jgi:hypothetical protein
MGEDMSLNYGLHCFMVFFIALNGMYRFCNVWRVLGSNCFFFFNYLLELLKKKNLPE